MEKGRIRELCVLAAREAPRGCPNSWARRFAVITGGLLEDLEAAEKRIWDLEEQIDDLDEELAEAREVSE